MVTKVVTPYRYSIFASVCWLLVSSVSADYVEVRRKTSVRAAASRSSEVVEHVEVGVQLDLLSQVKDNGYYRVQNPGTSHVGYVYQSFVRRYAGDLEEDSSDDSSESHSTKDFKKYEGPQTFAGYPKSTNSEYFERLENIGYAVGYSESRKDPLWATYKCEWTNSESPGKRPSKFKIDNRTEAKVSHEDYYQADYRTNAKSFDRGHMAPNFAIATRFGREAQLETFFMSNVCPQRSSLNQQTWEALEKRIATSYSFDNDRVWVTVGPIFGSSTKRLNGVSVIPESFFAIVIDDHTGMLRVLAIIMDQTVTGLQTLRPYATTVDSIENATGLDFFSELPDAIESDVEASDPDENWNLDELLIPTPH